MTACSPFDPRRSEWTALEITAQLLSIVTSFDGDEGLLDRLHPNNVLVPKVWITEFNCHEDTTAVAWEEWRHFVHSGDKRRVTVRDTATSLVDYRYATDGKAGVALDIWERRLVAVGRLLLGLLRNDYAAPRFWNIRGNEQILRLPRARWFQKLAISSPTLVIVEGCLGGRAAETRSISRSPGLFGWLDGLGVNDVEFDPPVFFGASALLDAIRHAQKVLQDNQLAVAMNQPRQLIPFRLSDFAKGAEGDGDQDDDAE